MFNVYRAKVNSSSLRSRLGMEPDLIQYRIIDTNNSKILFVVEGFPNQNRQLNKLAKAEVKRLVQAQHEEMMSKT